MKSPDPAGALPTGIVSITVLSEVRTTDTVFPFWLTTYACAPVGVTATPTGLLPTGTLAIMAVPLMTSTLFAPESAT